MVKQKFQIETKLSPLIDLRSFRGVTEMHSFVCISKLNRVWCNKQLVSLTNKSLLHDEAFSFNKSSDFTSGDEFPVQS